MKNVKLFFLIAVIFCSCSLFKKAQAPPHNNVTASMSKDIYDRINSMYDSMKGAEDKTFPTWDIYYKGIDAQLHTLLALDSTRSHNTTILKLTHDWDNRFEKYAAEHQQYFKLNNGQITDYQNFMNNVGAQVYQTEQNLK